MIIFMGVAGSGKSVQGKWLADELGYPWLSTGEFLRMLVSGERRQAMIAGQLLSDQEIIQLVRKMFSLIDTEHGFVMDGFPRTTAQADWLLNEAKHDQLNIRAVIHILASEDVVKKRLLARGRQDDTQEAIGERFDEYKKTILPILEDFKRSGVTVCDIDGERDPQVVHDDIVEHLKNT
jgi:adenylate kinase